MNTQPILCCLCIICLIIVCQLLLLDHREEPFTPYVPRGSKTIAATTAFPEYTLIGFVRDVRAMESGSRVDKVNTVGPFNRWIDERLQHPTFSKGYTNAIANRVAAISSFFVEGVYATVLHGYTYTHIHGHLFVFDHIGYTGTNQRIAVDVFVVSKDATILHTSVNGFHVDNPMPLPPSGDIGDTDYYPASMYTTSTNPNYFGGVMSITPDPETIRKFCKQRRKNMYTFSYCEINDKTYNIDEVQCVSRGGTIRRVSNQPSGLLNDMQNQEAIATVVNGSEELRSLYGAENDICANLSLEEEAINESVEHKNTVTSI